jgi:hypothetical protein
MKGRTELVYMVLLSISLTAVLLIGVSARSIGVSAKAHTAAMQLQGSPDALESPMPPEFDKSERTATCAQRDCQSPKHELALALAEDRRSDESKVMAAPREGFKATD